MLYTMYIFLHSILNQQNALIKAQQNISQNTLHVRYQLLHISAKWCNPQGVKTNNRFLSPKRVVVVVIVVEVVVALVVVVLVVVVVVVVVVVIVVVTVEISTGLFLVGLGQDITNNFGSKQA